MSTTPVNAIRVAELTDSPPNINTAIGNLATDIDRSLVPRFATTAARDTAIPSPTEGMVCYVSTNASFGRSLQIYNGSSWVNMYRSPIFVRKFSSVSRALTTTPTDDPELFLPMVANSTWEFTVHGFCTAETAADVRVHMAYPTGCTIFWDILGPGTTWGASTGEGVITGLSKLGDTSTFSGPIAFGGTSISTPLAFRANGIIYVGATAGNLRFQWAQNASTSNGVEIKAGSYMILSRIE